MVNITGKQINRGGGFGLKAPCIFWLSSPEAYLRYLELVDAAGGAASGVIEENPKTRSLDSIIKYLCELN